MLGVVGLVAYGWWVARAPQRPRPQADVVVVHAGREPDRSQRGIELMDRGVAPTLVLMLGDRQPSTRALCGQTTPYEVLCPDHLDPVNTRGEARALADLARQRGWRTAVTVTSDYHLRRATYLDARCSGLDVTGSGTADEPSRRAWFRHLVREMVALPVAAARGC